MPKPFPLRPGDTIRLVSPASPLKRSQLDVAIELFESWGYRVELGSHALEWTDHLAGPDEARAKDLEDAFLDDGVRAVFCTRGGYGCARLLPHLDLDAMAAAAPMFLGFSDITTLHLALNRRGLPTFHAPMPLTLTTPRSAWVLESLRRTLSGDWGFSADSPRAETIIGGSAEGLLTGGCLCLLTDSIGTRDAFDPAGKIVLIEDVDEPPHRIDAMLTHLLNEGSIRNAAAIVVGEMTRTDSKTDEGIGGRPWRAIVEERLGPLGIPMGVAFPFGHCANMLTLPLGVRARFDADAGRLEILEAPCAA